MIEIGEYVRTNCGKIGKLIRIEFDEIDTFLKWYVCLGKDEFGIEREIYINKPYIVKHSKNIINLIEVGDYVNGEKVKEINKNYITVGNMTLGIKELTGIKTIVTKEQFERVSFKV